ncbi:upstream activation factor subunit UAF30-like [Phalaenopsis equestris]|uniref:upstream activation factor subunit UAF30-like n=1 Tax=Phalaenopsis equestris TaxID=78828 RepID=UPI0009E37E9A|nr:upstream activation factor subunit UAF30-like [Phalaenopsis equestris]
MLRVFRGARPLTAAAKSQANAVAPGSRSAAEPKGILKPLPVSAAMRKFIGQPEISRAEAVKKVWDYIKLHQLQNPSNKKEIICDEKLKIIFEGKDRIGMMEIAKLLSPHFLKSK